MGVNLKKKNNTKNSLTEKNLLPVEKILFYKNYPIQPTLLCLKLTMIYIIQLEFVF